MVNVADLSKLAEEDQQLYRRDKPTLLSKYQIPVQHLEFDYIEKCQNGNELEKILHILRSGEEGHFPDLMQTAEKRLAELKPNSKLLRRVDPVLRKDELGRDEWSSLSQDLADWVQHVKKSDEELEVRKIKSVDQVGIDCKIRTLKQSAKQEANGNPKRIASTDYESWDKYDPDTEMLKMDLEDERVKKQTLRAQETKKTRPKVVRFSNFTTEAEAAFEANREKEKGNECYKAGEYKTALQHYSNSLECKPLAAVYTNRALIYNKLKQYDRAIDDCKSALKIEPRNLKAHLRMAQNYDMLGKQAAALQSVENAIEIDPNNNIAQQFANKLLQVCGRAGINTRLQIQDVESNTNESVESRGHCSPSKKLNKIQAEKEKSETKHLVIIPIPGTSRMLPPYYIEVYSNDPEVIKREKQKIVCKPVLMHITTIDNASDDECQTVENLEKRQTIGHKNVNDMKILKHNNKKHKQAHDSAQKQRSALQASDNKQAELNQNKGADGEPHDKPQLSFVPTIEELQSPYAFIQAWSSVKNDSTYAKHAEILRNLDFTRIDRIIGYKLESNMLSSMINCFYNHWRVPGELGRLNTALTHIVRIPRFKMTLMFLGESDRQRLHQLIVFLDQHGHNLPSDIKQIYYDN